MVDPSNCFDVGINYNLQVPSELFLLPTDAHNVKKRRVIKAF